METIILLKKYQLAMQKLADAHNETFQAQAELEMANARIVALEAANAQLKENKDNGEQHSRT